MRIAESLFLSNDEKQRRGALLLRTLPLAILPVICSMMVGLFIHSLLGWPRFERMPPLGGPIAMFLTSAIIFFIALILLARLGKPTISAVVFIAMWSLFGTLFALETGVTSYGPAILVLPICAAGLLLDGRASVALAALATLLVSAFGIFEFFGITIGNDIIDMTMPRLRPLFALGYWIAIFWTISALTWMLAGGFRHALDHSKRQANQLRKLSDELSQRVSEQTAELARRAAHAEVLYEISRAQTSAPGPAGIIDLIGTRAAQLLQFETVVVLQIDHATNKLYMVGGYNLPESLSQLNQHSQFDINEFCSLQQTTTHQLQAPTGEMIEIVFQPMHQGTAISGLLILSGLARKTPRSTEDNALIEGLADQAAVALAQKDLLLRLRESATLEERSRLAREIHDTLAQGLTSIVVQLGAAKQALADAPPEVLEHVNLARQMARESLNEARRSVWNLRAPALERGNLCDALAGLAERTTSPETQVRFELFGRPWELNNNAEAALLRVAQESLANVAKHAHASTVTLALTFTPDVLTLSVHDNGIGIDPTWTKTNLNMQSGAFGLLGMSERLVTLGGELTVNGNNGTEVRASLPRASTTKIVDSALSTAYTTAEVAL